MSLKIKSDPFVYTAGGRQKIDRQYLRWREEQGLAYCCEIPGCSLNSANPEWNKKPLKLIVDHINGVNSDNRQENLRLVCPNCNSQLPTHGGHNKGRVQKSSGGFALLDKETGLKGYTLVGEAGRYEFTGGSEPTLVSVVLRGESEESSD